MEVSYANGNLAATFLLFCLWVMLNFSQLEFKWSDHVIDALNQLHVNFITVSNDLFISWL